MRFAIVSATAVIAGGAILTAANAADLYTTPPPTAEAPPPPPVVEAPPAVTVAPPAVVVVPERRVFVEPSCPTIWRCGYWGCGWRASCAPVTAEVYGAAPGYAYYRYRPNWGHSHPRWGHWRHGG
jgi:hypothetical protein